MPLTPGEAHHRTAHKPGPPRRGRTALEPRPNGTCCCGRSTRRGPRPTSRCWTRPAELLESSTPRPAGTPPRARPRSRRDLANAERTLENVNESLIDSGVDGVVTAEALAQHNAVSATRLTGRGARRRGPHLGLRAHRCGRGAGTLRHAVAPADAPLPGEVLHRRRGHRPDELRRRLQLLGPGAGALRGGTLAARGADGELPDAGADRRGRRPDGHRGRTRHLRAEGGARGAASLPSSTRFRN
jgi:hypothetical protein